MKDDNLYHVNKDECEFFCNVVLNKLCKVFTPFEMDVDVDFPKKDELGGAVLKFLGGGAAYIKIQTEMPSNDEIKSIFDVGKFLQESYGDYVVIKVLCAPDIEIRDIEVMYDEKLSPDFISARKNDGDLVLDRLMDKLKNNEGFTVEDFMLKVILPFMSRKDENKFESKFCEFLKLFNQSNLKRPSIETLLKSRIFLNHWMSDDSNYIF